MKEAFSLLGALGALLCGPVLYLIFSTKYELLEFNHDVGLKLAVTFFGIWASFIALFIVASSGDPSFKRDKIAKTAFIGMILGGLSMIITSFIFGCLFWYNGSGQQPLLTRDVKWSSHRLTRGRHKRCYLKFRSQEDSSRFYELDFPASECGASLSGRPGLRLSTKPGRLGYEWVVNSELLGATGSGPEN